MVRVPQSGKKVFRISEVITDHGTSLGIMLRRAGVLVQIEKLLSSELDRNLAGRFQVATIRENRLILISPTASSATLLKMQAPKLVKSLHQAGFTQIEHIDVRVAPLCEIQTDTRKKRALSPAARQALDSIAKLEADSED